MKIYKLNQAVANVGAKTPAQPFQRNCDGISDRFHEQSKFRGKIFPLKYTDGISNGVQLQRGRDRFCRNLKVNIFFFRCKIAVNST